RAACGILRRCGIQALLERTAELSRRLHDALEANHCAVRPFPQRHRSTILSVPVDDAEAVMARLRAANVVASVRAGRIRLSVHFYNIEGEMGRGGGAAAH